MSRTLISKEEFIAKGVRKYGLDVVNRYKDKITPCDCGAPQCQGWQVDPDHIFDAQEAAANDRR